MANFASVPVVRFYDNNNVPLRGGLVSTYLSGTSTPATTYTDVTGLVQNTNPVVLNSRGEAAIFLSGASLKYVVTDALGNPIQTLDPVTATSSATAFVTYTTTGTATAYVLTPDPMISGNNTRLSFLVRFHVAAGTTPTLAVSGFAALPLDYLDGTGSPVPINASLLPTSWTSLVYSNGSQWIVAMPYSSGSVAGGPFVAATTGSLSTTVAAQTAGGTVFVPNAIAGGTFPASPGAVAVDFLGPNTPHPMYDETTLTTRAARLFRGADPGAHPGLEHSLVSIVAQPAGSGDASVPASDFALSVSAVKKGWAATTTVGQVVAINIASRGGTQGSDSTNGAGDMGNLIINSVNSSLNHSNSALEAVIYNAPGGAFVPGTYGISVQLAVIKPSVSVAYGLVLVAKNGGCGPAILIGNTMGDSAGNASWNGPISYQYSTSPTITYEAFKVNQAGNVVMNAGPSVATPAKTIRVGSGGALEVLNNAGTVTTTFADNGPLVNEFGQLVLRTATTGTNIKTLIASGGHLQVLSSTGAVIFDIDNTGNVTAGGTISGGGAGSASQVVLTAASGSTPAKTLRSATTGDFQILNNAGTVAFTVSDAGVPYAEQGQVVVRNGTYPSGVSFRINSLGNGAIFNASGVESMSVNASGAVVLPPSGSITFFNGSTYTQAIGARITGWATPSGAQNFTNFDPATVTLQTLAQQVLALKAALHGQAGGHGLIGN